VRGTERAVAIMWGMSVLAVLIAVVGLIYMARGGLDYPAFGTASWFVTLTVILGLLLVIACLWNGWYVLTRVVTDRAIGPVAEPAWVGALASLSLAIAFGIVVVRAPANGVAVATINCPTTTRCYFDYGNSRTELGVATIAFIADTLLFGTVAVWAMPDDTDDEE
jgi:hypothetical protein